MNTNNTTKNNTLTAAQKRAITIANKKAIKAIEVITSSDAETIVNEIQVIKTKEALAVLDIETYNALMQQSNEFLSANELTLIEHELIESSAKIHDLQKAVVFRALEVETELQSNLIAVSDSKKDAMQKNYINRLKANKAFTNASQASLQLIVKYSNETTLDYLLNASNYKTASRILDAAKMLNDEKHSSILDYTLHTLKRSVMQQTSVDAICNISNQCYSRISNAVKALAFFNLIIVKDCSIDNKTNIISKMSKNTLVSLNA